jgi:hypothetical protein
VRYDNSISAENGAILSRVDGLPPRVVKAIIDATRYPADLQPVRQLYFTLVPYINRGKTIIMSL